MLPLVDTRVFPERDPGALAQIARRVQSETTSLESASQAVLVTDPSGTILWTSQGFSAISGYRAEEAIGRTPRFLQSGRHDRGFYRNLWQRIRTGETWKGEVINRRKDGSLYYGAQTITPVRASEGEITHFVAVMDDITELHTTRAELRAAHEQLRELTAQNASVTYGLTRRDGVPVLSSLSANFEELTGTAAREAVHGNWWKEHLHPTDLQHALASFDDTIAAGTSRTEYRLRRSDGTYRWVEDTRRLIADEHGANNEFVGVWNDITERKIADERLRTLLAGKPVRSRPAANRDLLWLAVLCTIVFSFADRLKLFETVVRSNQANSPWCDEIFGTLVVLIGGLSVFSFRRWREAHAENLWQARVADALQRLNGEMERKVEQRTAELARNNDALHKEVAERRRVERELRLFRSQVDQASDTLEVIDPETGRFLDVSAKGPADLGYSREEYLTLRVADIASDVTPENWPDIARRIRSEGTLKGEGRHQRKDGTSFPVEFNSRWVRLERDYIVTCVRDISKRQETAAALHEQREQWRTLVNASISAVFVVQDERVVFANPGMTRMLGTTQEKLIGCRLWDFLHEDYHELARHRQKIVHEISEALPPIETQFWRCDGTMIDIESTGVHLLFHGKPAMLIEARDITARKRAAVKLQETESRFRQLAESVHEVFWLTSTSKEEMLYISPGYERVWGLTCESLYAAPYSWINAIHPDDRARVVAALDQQVAGTYDEVYRVVHPDGAERWVRDRAFPVRDENGKVRRIAGVAEDITEAKRAEMRLTLQHAVTTRLAEGGSLAQATQGVMQCVGETLGFALGEFWLLDRPTSALRCTEAWRAVGAEVEDLMTQGRQLAFAKGEGLPGSVWATGQATRITALADDPRCTRRAAAAKAGMSHWIGLPVMLRHELFGVLGFFTAERRSPDNAIMMALSTVGSQLGQFIERQQLADQFRQAQKMEAIGTLAGGIAHDFNNIIAGVMGYTELAKMDVGTAGHAGEYLDAILKSARRASDLVRQIMAFSRQQEQKRVAIQLRHVIAEALHLLRATIPTTIEFENHLARDLPAVLADASQIHQVVMNLCTNAWHAMRERGGRLRVTLEGYDVDAMVAERHAGLRPGPYVRLSVADTGHGMDAATLARIFEPFFTTKGPGEGTGLGLAVVHGIMQSHDGIVTVYSQPGEGTVFRLYFPALKMEGADQVTTTVATPCGQGQRVLFIDDEEALVHMSKRVLESLGYHVETHTHPLDALEAFQQAPDAYDVVVTDLTMPVLTGVQVAEQVLAVRPKLPVLLMSGHAANLTAGQIQDMGLRDLLLKPMSMHTLGSAVARALEISN